MKTNFEINMQGTRYAVYDKRTGQWISDYQDDWDISEAVEYIRKVDLQHGKHRQYCIGKMEDGKVRILDITLS